MSAANIFRAFALAVAAFEFASGKFAPEPFLLLVLCCLLDSLVRAALLGKRGEA